MEEKELEFIRTQLAGYMERSRKSQREIAKSMGISDSALSMFVKGSYPGDNEQIARKAAALMELARNQSVAVKLPGFVETRTSSEIMGAANYAQTHRDISVVFGDAGIGKTMAITEFARHNPSVIMVTADVTSTVKSLLEDILEKLGCREIAGSRSAARRQIVRELKGSNRMVIIDEAQHLRLPTLEAVRGIIYDACQCAVLLCGNEQVYTRLLGKQRAPFAQLFSRVGLCRGFVAPSYKVTREDVKNILCQEIEISDVCIDYLHTVANKAGALRGLVKLFTLTCEVALETGEEINIEMIQKAERYMISFS